MEAKLHSSSNGVIRRQSKMDEKTIQAKELFAKAERKTKRRWKKGWTKPNLIKAAHLKNSNTFTIVDFTFKRKKWRQNVELRGYIFNQISGIFLGDCVWSDWASWTTCGVQDGRTCGLKQRTREREILIPKTIGDNCCERSPVYTEICGYEPCGMFFMLSV